MATTFFTGGGTDVRPAIDGVGERDLRYVLTNSRNRNRKIIRVGATVDEQFLGINAPTVAPTGAGTGAVLYYVYVYVNSFFVDPLALEEFPYIRGNQSPVLTTPSQTTPPTLTFTVSTDPQVTHIWAYVGATAEGPFYLISQDPAFYQVANTGAPTLVGVTTVPTDNNVIEVDNYVPDTARGVVEVNGFYNLFGYVAQTANGDATIGVSIITGITGATMYDGVIALFFQFTSDTTGGPSNNGIHIANFLTSTSLQLVDQDGVNRAYDGPGNKSGALFRLWRSPAVIQITKRWNPDAIPGIIDPNYLILANGPVTGMAKPTTGFAPRIHTNASGKKSVEIADFTQGVPPKRMPTSSPYAMANPQAWTAAGGRLFYWDTGAGGIEDRGSNHVPMTQSVIPNLVRSLNKASNAISMMAFDESRNLLFIAVAPTGYTKNYYLIVYNLTTNTWNLWFMLPDVLCMARIEDASTGEILIYMGSSKGSITTWPSVNFNEAVGTSQAGVLSTTDDATHLTVIGTPFPTAGDALVDRWVMVWDDTEENPVYQFARIASNTSSRLTLDTFIGPGSTSGFSPIPTTGNAYWVGPIQSILGPNWEFNSVPDDDGHTLDISLTTSGLDQAQDSRISLYRNFETDPVIGSSMTHNKYADQSVDPDHQSWKAQSITNNSVEAVGVTGWQVTDNNEAPLSIKAIIKRVRAVSEKLNGKK